MVVWAVAFAGADFVYHRIYSPPGDWIGALIVSFFVALGVGSLRKSRIDNHDAMLIALPDGPPRDGERTAIAGTLDPTGAPLQAPFSGAECVAYEYTVHHDEPGKPGERSTSVQDRMGLALAPCTIRAGVRDIRLLAFPALDNFPQSTVDENRARTYLATASADDQSLGRVFLHLDESAHLFDDGSGGVRKDWLLTRHRDLSDARFTERAIPAGAQVCVIGNYSAEKNAIVPNASGGGVQMLRGTRKEALETMRASRAGDLIIAAFLIVVPALVAWGILTHREHWLVSNRQSTITAPSRP
ncbi:MAG TPA: hypothetical protein VL284_04205 [Thermoanaerobaculia bacterium]|nr:hypothetical protein [Thermoanaerobaculia bacterium]